MSRLAKAADPGLFVQFGNEAAFQQEVSSRLSATRGAPVTCTEIGVAESGHPILGYLIGSGTKKASLIAGSHADEPVGPETLRTFIRTAITTPEKIAGFLERFTFVVIPHVNPDGESENAAWIKRWPSIDAYLKQAVRELPGRDIEFGYPDMRYENEAAAGFLGEHGPFDLHMSLHSMGFSDGALLLVERSWVDRSGSIQEAFKNLAAEYDFRLHDHDRGGEKGFEYIGPGFTTTPEGARMREYFEKRREMTTAAKFKASSMEFVRSLGGDPLCLVPELPLFLIKKIPANEPKGDPQTYLKLKAHLPAAQRTANANQSIDWFIERYGLKAIPAADAIRFQLGVIQIGLDAVG
ncbi:MAG TPA: M14 family zinc carboxypeptidase [Rhodothermales bacterium]|nr:M14 family zinc carboxypeptidase [Rhodothermales bacterium]